MFVIKNRICYTPPHTTIAKTQSDSWTKSSSYDRGLFLDILGPVTDKCVTTMNKKDFPDDYFWPHHKDMIFDHLDDLEKLWKNHLSDFELIKKWMALQITEALSMLMEADALAARMGNRIEFIKTTEMAFVFISHLNEMQEQCKCLKEFIDDLRNPLHYKEEKKRNGNIFSHDIPFKRPKTLFDEIIPDEFNSDRKYYKPMSLDNYSYIIGNITGIINNLYGSLERFTSYVLEERDGFEMHNINYRITADIEMYKSSNLFLKYRKELIDMIPYNIKRQGCDICLNWLKRNELLKCYVETQIKCDVSLKRLMSDDELTPEDKRLNAIVLKVINSGPVEWSRFLTHLILYDEIKNGLCFDEENGVIKVDDIEASLHPELQKEIYESYIRLHPDKRESYKSKHEHFPPGFTKEQGIKLYRFLVNNSFIHATTDEASFLFRMGFISELPDELQKIIWLKNKQLLRELLELLFEKFLNNNSLKLVELERLTPFCFKDKNNEPLKLAKRKKILSQDSDILKTFCEPLATL